MGKFQTDPDELRQASAEIRAARRCEIGSTVDSVTEVGHQALETSIASFSHGWTRGLSHLFEDIEEVANRLDKTAMIYVSGDESANTSICDAESEADANS